LELASVILARTLGYIETVDLNPRGKVFYPDLVQELVNRYKFLKYPKTIEEFDESKGVEFLEGKIGNTIIQKLTIFQILLVVETRSSTDDSKQILEEMLTWAAAKFNLNYHPGQIKRFAYVSSVTFYSDVPILNADPALANLAKKTSELLTGIWQEPIHYEPTNVIVGHDALARKYSIASFTIQRRAEAKFSENKYFSEAPLPTDVHISLLEQYEADVKRMHGTVRK
jgi:hypothetical protein